MELVGVGEYLPFNIWAINFLKEQGQTVKSNTLFQDNEGAILMEKNVALMIFTGFIAICMEIAFSSTLERTNQFL